MEAVMTPIQLAHEKLADKYSRRNQAIVESIWSSRSQGETFDTSMTQLADQYGMSPQTLKKLIDKLLDKKAISISYTPARKGQGRITHITLRKSVAVAKRAVVFNFKDNEPTPMNNGVQALISSPEVVETLQNIGNELSSAKTLVDACRTYIGNIDLIKANCASLAAIGIEVNEQEMLNDIYDEKLDCIAQVMPYIGFLENK